MTEGILKPGDTIGILGGGQLGRMLCLAAANLGLKTHVYCPDPDSPAFDVAAGYTIAPYDDTGALKIFAAACAVVTYEFENVPGPAAALLNTLLPVRPGVKALEVSQDRLNEKEFLRSAGAQLAGYEKIDGDDDLVRALSRFGGTGVLKTRRFGYDGKGQVIIRTQDALTGALDRIGRVPAVLEQLINFDREVSVIVARDLDGLCETYDVAENHHENHILKTSTVPAKVNTATADKAREVAISIVENLDYIGVCGVEMFVGFHEGKEELVVNEIAPRVHNSGHWTEDACLTSQFEQHIRAIAGWPLGSARRHSDVVMENLIGEECEAWPAVLTEPNTRLHLYGKADVRAGRKMGHVNRIKQRSG